MTPHNELVGKNAFCLAKEGDIYLVYIPDGKETVLHAHPTKQGYKVTWINPRSGRQINPRKAMNETITLRPPSIDDWATIIKSN
jgi:hypothetical protein